MFFLISRNKCWYLYVCDRLVLANDISMLISVDSNLCIVQKYSIWWCSSLGIIELYVKNIFKSVTFRIKIIVIWQFTWLEGNHYFTFRKCEDWKLNQQVNTSVHGPFNASSCLTSSAVRTSCSPVAGIQSSVPRGKRLQLNISGQGNPNALITGTQPSRTASHKLLQGLTGPLSSGRHTGANSEHRNFLVSRWHSLEMRGSQAADCCWASLSVSWPSKLGTRICL